MSTLRQRLKAGPRRAIVGREFGRGGWPMIRAAALVATGYYLGARLGLALRLPDSPLSALWPPNAVLLTALLVLPVNRWWIPLAAMVPAHVAAHVAAGFEPWQLGWQMVGNALGAGLAAGGILVWLRRPLRFDSVREASVFITVAVAAVPLLTSFLSAAVVVQTGWYADYWGFWTQRSINLAISHLTLVPILVPAILDGRRWLRESGGRLAEAALVVVGLLGTGWIAFALVPPTPGLGPMLLYAPLPFFLWAALRFGPPGAAAAVLGAALIAAFSMRAGVGPFTAATAGGTPSVELFMLAAALPMLLLAAGVRERTSATAALASGEARFRALFESNAVPILYWHADGRVLDANDAYLQLCGQTREDLEEGRVRWDRVGPSHPIELGRRDIAQLRSGIRAGVPFEKEYRLPDGRRIPVLIAGSLMPGCAERGLAFAIDLAKQKRADEEQARLNEMLERERRRLDDVIANVPGVVWETWTEPQGFIRRAGFVSDYVRNLTGYSPAEWLSRPNFWLSLVHEEDRARAEREAVQFVLGLRTGTQELRWVTRDGRVLWVESHVAPIHDESGKPVGLRGITLDITARKLAQLEREKSDARNRAILQAVPDLMFILDKDGVYVDYFARTEADLLVPPDQFLGRNQRDVLPPELNEVLRRASTEVQGTGGVRVVEYELPINGEPRWWEARIVPCGTDQILTILREITERKQAERRLIETQKRYALATAAGRVAVWSYDSGTGRFETDPLLHEILGLDRKQAGTHQALLDRLHPDDLERVARYEKLLLKRINPGGGESEPLLPEMEHRVFDSHGNVRWFLTRGAIARGEPGTPARVIGTAMEITALKKAEQWLREGEARFRALAETVPDIIFTSAADGSRDYVSPQFYAYTGLPAGSALGFGWQRALHPDDRERHQQQWLWAASNGSSYENEYRLCAPDGSYRWYFGRSIPVRSDGGSILKWVSCATDITARKLAEQALHESKEALRESKDQIHRFVGRLLLDREEEQKRISLDLHDDLNQRIAALAISLSALKREIEGPREAVHQTIASIQKRTEELSEHVRDLSRRLHSATLHHVGLLPALRALSSDFARKDGLEIEVDSDGGHAPLPAHVELCLFRVAEESLRNVARHAGVRSARLSLSSRNGRLDLRISDEGRGFDLVKARAKGGMGLLGLEERMRVIGGKLEILTHPGAGATVIGHVPLPPPGQLTTPAAPAAPAALEASGGD